MLSWLWEIGKKEVYLTWQSIYERFQPSQKPLLQTLTAAYEVMHRYRSSYRTYRTEHTSTKNMTSEDYGFEMQIPNQGYFCKHNP